MLFVQNMHEDEIFVRVVEAGSLRAVAMELGVDPSSVSRKVTALEERLQAKLLRRSTKRSVPTEAGQQYYDGVRRLLDQRAMLEADVSGLVDEPRGRLTIGAPVDFGARFVSPVIASMLQDFEYLDIELVLGSGFDDLAEKGLDAVVRIGRLPDSSLIARKVGAVPRMIVCSSDYAEQNGLPEAPDELSRHPFVFYQGGQRRLALELQRDGELVPVEATGRVSANSVTAVRRLVLAGAGLHHGPQWAFESDLREGRVKAVLPEWKTMAFPLSVVWIASPYQPAKLRVFAERFADLVKGEPALNGDN